MLPWQVLYVSLPMSLLVELRGRVAMQVFLSFVSDLIVVASHTILMQGYIDIAVDMAVFLFESGVVAAPAHTVLVRRRCHVSFLLFSF